MVTNALSAAQSSHLEENAHQAITAVTCVPTCVSTVEMIVMKISPTEESNNHPANSVMVVAGATTATNEWMDKSLTGKPSTTGIFNNTTAKAFCL